MKFIFAVLTLFAFIPSSWANITACSEETPDCSNGTCTCPAGCKYGLDWQNNPTCTFCESGQYGVNCANDCPRVNSNNATPTWESHQYWDSSDPRKVIRGARTIYECYVPTSNGGTCKKAESHNETTDQPNCRKYYRNDNKYFVSCSSATGSDANADWNHNTGTNESDGSVNTSATSDFHIDSDDTCRANNFSCKLLIPNTHTFGRDSRAEWCITEDFATWGNGGWNITDCGYRSTYNYEHNSYGYHAMTNDFTNNVVHAPFLSEVNQTDINCYAVVKIHVPTGNSNLTGLTYAQVNNLTTTPHLDDLLDTGAAIAEYTCIGCKPGYAPSNEGLNSDDFNSCKKVDPGYYSTGCSTRNRNDIGMGTNPNYPNCEWWCQSFFHNENRCDTNTKKPCFAGMTTLSEGSTRKEQCHYTSDTQFCDAYGCFNFNSLTQRTSRDNPNHPAPPAGVDAYKMYDSENQSENLLWIFPNSYR